jgi:plasmid stabilization system protein ParE
MTYDVIVESCARKDIDDAFRWMVTNTSPENAVDCYLEIYGAMDSLRDFPARCGFALENEFFKEEIRQLICGKYRLLFEIHGETVRVLHVRHSARRPLKPKSKRRSV